MLVQTIVQHQENLQKYLSTPEGRRAFLSSMKLPTQRIRVHNSTLYMDPVPWVIPEILLNQKRRKF